MNALPASPPEQARAGGAARGTGGAMLLPPPSNPSQVGWADACQALALLAVDPLGLGGACIRAGHGPVRTRWLALLRGLLPETMPWRKVPLSIADARLLGGLDLAATLAAGRPVAEQGLLADAAGGFLLLPMAERAPAGLGARLAGALDAGKSAVLALDEGDGDEEQVTPALRDRMAFHVKLSEIGVREPDGDLPVLEQVAEAQSRLPDIQAGDGVLEALCRTAAVLGIASVRAPLLALRAARAAAALAGRDAVSPEDAALAGRLVLAHRATVLPAPSPPADADPPPPADGDPVPDPAQPDTPRDTAPDAEPDDTPSPAALDDILLQAVQAAIPPGLLALLQARAARRAPQPAGTSGAPQLGRRGRPAGTRGGDPRGAERLNLVETLRAAAPWQRLRGAVDGRVQIRRDDFRVTRHVQRAPTTTIFVVDASGSTALNRLAEAKGAVELLLAECYVRRDEVAVLAFRGAGAQVLLPPTRSLVRAKRSLSALPGGGGTPLAAGLDAGLLLAAAVRRRGATPALVLLTDGRGNVARDGRGGRERAEADTQHAARALRASGVGILLVDTSPRPAPAARRLAEALDARYLPLPYGNAAALSLAAGRMAAG